MFGMMTANPTLFDSVTIPAGMDREILVNTILLRCADYEVAYPDANFLQLVTNNFFDKYRQTFENWWRASQEEYNPIYNYDRFEELRDGTKEKGSAKSNTSGTTENDVSAYDTSNYQHESRVNDKSNVASETENQRDYSASNHIYGNIGVTTSTAMVIEFDEAQTKINPYNLIAELYAVETCLLVE